MPHITVTGSDTGKQIKVISIHAVIQLSPESFHSPAGKLKIDILKYKLEQIVEEYYDSVESKTYSNHEWNTRNK